MIHHVFLRSTFLKVRKKSVTCNEYIEFLIYRKRILKQKERKNRNLFLDVENK